MFGGVPEASGRLSGREAQAQRPQFDPVEAVWTVFLGIPLNYV